MALPLVLTLTRAHSRSLSLVGALLLQFDDVPPEWRTLLLEAGIYPSDMSSESRCNAISAAVASAIRSAITEKVRAEHSNERRSSMT